VDLYQPLAHQESQPNSTHLAEPGVFQALEGTEYPFVIGERQADSLISDGDDHALLVRSDGDPDVTTVRGILDGILKQVVEDTLQP